MRTALMVGILAAAVTLGGVAPAHADAAGVTAPAAVPVQGTYRDGDTLTAVVSAIAWGGTPEAISVQWLEDGRTVGGAIAATFGVDADDVGRRVAVRVTATVSGAPMSVESSARTVQPGITSERRLRSRLVVLGLLTTQVWREAIPPGLPDGVRQASKPGTLWTATGMVQTDSAIVWGPWSRYVLVVMGSNGATTHSITRISRLVSSELEGAGGRAFVYDHQQMRATGTVVLTSSVSRTSRVLGTYPSGTKVEVIDSKRTRYLVRIGGRTGWIDNAHLTLRHKIL